MTDEGEFSARSQLKWAREGDAWILLYGRLTEREVGELIEAMKGNRWGHRDATMVLIAFRHGLRASELVDLRWGAG